MSTFTSILQQRINALENQIRNLQEQNNNLRRRARYLMEAAASTDMSGLPLADASQVPNQVGPSGVYTGNPDRYTMSTDGSNWTEPPFGQKGWPATPSGFERNPTGEFTDENGTVWTWSYDAKTGILTLRAFRSGPNGPQVLTGQRYHYRNYQWEQM